MMGQNGQFVSALDWELYSSTPAHLKNDLSGVGTLNTPSFRPGSSLFAGGKTLQCKFFLKKNAALYNLGLITRPNELLLI
jgi:hypothetical protein